MMADKKKIRRLLLAVLAGMLGISGTAAYQTAFDGTVNRISVGNNTTFIEEEFPDPTPVPLEEDPEYQKKVWVSNTASGEDGHNVDCYVRIALGYSNSDIGKAVTLKNLDTENWVYKDDGYYYYKKLLREGESTTPLFTGVSIDSSRVEQSFLDTISEFEIQVYEESVQAEGAEDYEGAWRHWQASESR